MAILDAYLNGYHVGEFKKSSNGAHSFSYSTSWLTLLGSRPISLSMPLVKSEYRGDVVYNYFDNLLPDNSEVRQRIVARYQANSSLPFDLLTMIGRDCVGALQLLPKGELPLNVKNLEYKVLDGEELNKIIMGYRADIPLGMIEDLHDFRISVAGAQEKTALLNIDKTWCLPLNSTPTSHIIKLPIGQIQSHSYSLDMSESVENEFLCMLLLKAYGLSVARCEVLELEDINALSVERFDRQYSSDKKWLMRRPQEDYCQVFNTPSALKYENQGGPGIEQIMNHLLGSKNAAKDRADFMKVQVLFWLMGASDGHAKNFSIFILPDGQFQLTPFYDVLSVFPVVNKKGLNIRQVKLAMGLKTTKGKKYHVNKIYPRHFIETAKQVGFEIAKMDTILSEVKVNTEKIILDTQANLPVNFPKNISESIFSGMLQQLKKL
ncbi:type II toxin-antitoxin system HipA family toxin [Vibrio sp. 1-Bac 57]|uniref:type II toxin-antitoxin system HipA family toxin n=1 Tax=Psychromonas arctica TaxID=168275 RepID=UPI000426B289|nr:type II toxin-antitoxin system HipA family toxin [Psychromonas arctica]